MVGTLMVVSGPSGGGKSTILERALRENPGKFVFSVSYTTRLPRGQEKNGIHYNFVELQEMKKMIENGEFIEYATFGENIYGTRRKFVEDIINEGKTCILDVELQGVMSIKRSHFPAKYILIRPPSIQILEERLRKRATDSEEAIEKRLKQAKVDLETVDRDEKIFDLIIENNDVERAYNKFISFVKNK